jgi:glycosyltransferase involved in cell wall biosynthesis
MIGDLEVGGTEGGFTHLWMLQDTFQLANTAGAIRQACLRAKVASFYYFPVDAPLAPGWTTIIAGVDTPVAYCDYGREETIKALRTPMFSDSAHDKAMEAINLKLKLTSKSKPAHRANLLEEREDRMAEAENTKAVDIMREQAAQRVLVLPHGVDTEVYRPLESEKFEIRKRLFQDRVKPTDFLILNVSQHQKRKGLAQSLLVLRDIKAMRPELSAKLYLHSASINPQEGTDLREVATQLDLEDGVDVFYGDSYFVNNYATAREDTLNRIYNAADLLLSTSYGEGWGMPLTEAMAAGIPVAGPRHTSVAEILGEDRGILFGTLGSDMMIGDNSRLRPRIDVNGAAIVIISAATAEPVAEHSLTNYRKRSLAWTQATFLNWDRIAGEWLKLFDGIAL